MSLLGQKRTNHHGQMRPLCPLLSDSDQITDPAALPCTLTHSESWSRFKVWWLAWAAVERQDAVFPESQQGYVVPAVAAPQRSRTVGSKVARSQGGKVCFERRLRAFYLVTLIRHCQRAHILN